MRSAVFAFAVAATAAAALSSPAHAYCRGCSISPEAAAAAAAGAAYGQAIMGGNAQAYAPPPMPDSSATFEQNVSGGAKKTCHTEIRRSWDSEKGNQERRVEVCN